MRLVACNDNRPDIRVWSIIIFVLSLIFDLSLIMENNESFDLTLIDDA